MTEQIPSREQIIAHFGSGPSRLAAAVASLSDKALDLSPAPGEWSIRQIVHHLADGNDIWSTGLKKAIFASGALLRFEGFPGNDPWAEAMHYDKRSIQPALALFTAHIQVMVQLLEEFPTAWGNTMVLADAEGKAIQTWTIGTLIDMLSKHLDGHLVTIAAIKQQFDLDGVPVNPARVLHKLTGANMDIDLTTPQGDIAWKQMKCPWNEVEGAAQHRCAVKNVSICPYFSGVEKLDTLLCCYPHQ